MQSEVMGKTMAILMVMAMIATGIVLIPESTNATGAYTVTGHLKDDVTDANVGGVKVTITNATLSVNKNVTSLNDGKFTLSVELRGDYTLTFEKTGYRTKVIELLNTTFNETSKKADVGIQLIEPLPTVSGTVKELGTVNVINDVEVTVKDGATVIDQVMTVNGAFSVPVDSLAYPAFVNIYFKKNGYYDNNLVNVAVAAYGTTNVGEIHLEKIVPTPTIKVWGIVFEDGTTTTLPGAIVSITAGDDKWITAVSDDMGYFEMLAYSGNFQIQGTLTGYKSSAPEWFNVPADKSVRKDIHLEKTPAETQTISGTITETDGATPIEGAGIYLHSTDGKYVNHTTSDVAGAYTMNFYPGATFVLEVKKEGYFTNASLTGITVTVPNQDVELTAINTVHTLRGFVYDADKELPLEGAHVGIFSKNYLYSQATTTMANGYYEFMVHNASSFFMVVDSEGYQSTVIHVNNIVANRYQEVDLHPSGSDEVKTSYTFEDWHTLKVTRNSIITVDNITVRWNAERMFGMGLVGLTVNNGDLSTAEVQAWADQLTERGPEKRNTKEFLTLNNSFYQLNATSYAVTIEGADGPVSADATIFINSTFEYALVGDLENPDSSIFKLVFNATYDTEIQDNIYEIYLPMTPSKFEMTGNVTETNKVIITGYNNPITVNPMTHTEGTETVTMTVERSMNGTARAKVVDGTYHVLNNTYEGYEVMVPRWPANGADTTITFSAEESTDKIGDINKANFTWHFGDGDMGYGIRVEHNYTDATFDGELTVRLVITETGGNKTYYNFTLWLDSQNPVAVISAHLHDADNMTFSSNVLTVREDTPITFSGIRFSDVEGMDMTDVVGLASYDDIKAGDRKGIIEKWYWSWGEEDSFDETVTKDGNNNITHTYSKPGTYTINMIATDVVGRESANATWTVKVLDITAPVADFNIRNADGVVVTEVIENKTYTYNASLSMDNYDEDLTFEWSFEVGGGVYTNYTGPTAEHMFTKVGLFNVTLMATDKAGNTGNRTMQLYVNLDARPNIIMRLGTMRFESSPGTAGKAMTISVNITNDGNANATGIQTKFYIRNADGTDKEIGTATTASLAMGETETVSVSWTPNKKGEYSIWANATCAGEHSSQWWDNKIDDFNVQKVTVNEASWVMPAIIIAVIVVIIMVFLGMRYFMKTGTKEEEVGEKRKKR